MVLLYSNRSTVLRLIQKTAEKHPKWKLGKKALQKSFYFFNLKHNTFSFKWANFGPMSGEIQQIVRDLEAAGRIEIEPVRTRNPNAVLQSIKYVPNNPTLTIPSELDDTLDATVQFVAEKDSRTLELLASVHFWAIRNYHNEDVAEYVHRMLDELKPDANFTKVDVEFAIRTLKEQRLLS